MKLRTPAVAASITALLAAGGTHAAEPSVHYEILLDRPQTQTVTLRVRLDEVNRPTVELKLPTWRMGKYEVLDQAGDIRWYRARDGSGRELAVTKRDKSTWRIDTGGAGTVVMEYEIYANDLGNRTKHVDDTHAFLDAAATMMYAPARRDQPLSVRVRAPEGWDVATGLEPGAPRGEAAWSGDPTLFVAAGYDVLVDSPFEIGIHDRLSFDAAGVPHEIVIWGSEDYDAEAPAAAIAEVLDDWHAAAAAADRERYVGHLAVETVFMGTDATEHWDREAFLEYLTPHFERGDGWAFAPRDRRITVAEDGRTAWFDELLDSSTYGELRGSGVLIREGGGWKIAQYNLSIPLPNELAPDIVEQISNR